MPALNCGRAAIENGPNLLLRFCVSNRIKDHRNVGPWSDVLINVNSRLINSVFILLENR